jgi:hypothetical protein
LGGSGRGLFQGAYPEIRLEKCKKPIKNLSQHIQLQVQDSYLANREYKSEALRLLLEATFSFQFVITNTIFK